MVHILDLPSQANAVQEILRGKSPEEKIQWLAKRGRISLKQKIASEERQVYYFESTLGKECAFFIDGDELVFLKWS